MNSVLVNFRIPENLLEQFDGTCRLAGLTRTQLLRHLIGGHVRETSANLPQRIEEDRQISKAIKYALRHRDSKLLAPDAAQKRNGAQRRLKSFSEHILRSKD
jgi:antitoxin component of RelBE/YafQ-DinJ toxin-antitoxin module